MAGVPFDGRVLPLAVCTFEYPWKEKSCDSQNRIEELFLLDIETALPEGCSLSLAAIGATLGPPCSAFVTKKSASTSSAVAAEHGSCTAAGVVSFTTCDPGRTDRIATHMSCTRRRSAWPSI